MAAQTTAVDIQVTASVLHGAKDLRMEIFTLPPPAPDEVQVSIRATGLCGSDLHYYNHGRNGDIIMREPMSLGHESSGIITALGSSVSTLSIGDAVALEVGLPCETCDRCTEGRYNICKAMKFAASAKIFPHKQGTLRERVNHPARYCHRLPVGVGLEMGALLEPLGVAIQATKRAQVVGGSTTLVFGAGAVGILVAAMAKISGSSTVVIADIDPGRIAFAVDNGFADKGFTVPMKRGATIEEQLDIAKETAAAIGAMERTSTLNAGAAIIGEVDCTFECTGVPSCLQAAIYSTRPGGRVLLIGMGTPIQTLPISAAALREVDLMGVFRYANTYPTGIEVVSKSGPGYPDFRKLVTHRFKGFGEVEKAFGMAGRVKDDEGQLVMKVMIDTSGEREAVAGANAEQEDQARL